MRIDKTPFLHDREAVEQQSPGSRSAPWVTVSRTSATPTGLNNLVTPCGTLSAFVLSFLSRPRVRCATLGSVVSTPMGSADRNLLFQRRPRDSLTPPLDFLIQWVEGAVEQCVSVHPGCQSFHLLSGESNTLVAVQQ